MKFRLKLRTKKKLKKQARKLLPYLLITLLAFFLGSYKTDLVPNSYEISAKELNSKLSSDNDLFLVNVHSPYDGELAGTDAFIEHDMLLTNKSTLPTDKNAQIILYCRSGNMSASALSELQNMGYTNVKHLKGGMNNWRGNGFEVLDLSKLAEDVVPENGIILPVGWGDLGPNLVRLGVIDQAKFEKAMSLSGEQAKILSEGSSQPIVITSNNSRFVVNMLWALGLAQKSSVYDLGPMGQEHKDKVGNFASTGGWSMAKEEATIYLNRHDLINLNTEQQQHVYEIASNIYRPCCGNSTAFPDCNHGMAALGAIELMVAQGINEQEIYNNILALNSFWFPDTYIALATKFAREGTSWSQVDSKLALSENYSSAASAQKIYNELGPLPATSNTGGTCGV